MKKKVKKLIDGLKSKHVNVRIGAAVTLGEMDNQDAETLHRAKAEAAPAVPTLIEVLRDDEAPVRENAAKALGQIGDPRAVGALTEALGDHDRSVRVSVVGALGQIGDAQAVAALAEALRDDAKVVRNSAIDVLVHIDSELAVTVLNEALKNGVDSLRESIVEVLERIGGERVEEALVDAALQDTDWHVRESACNALRHAKGGRAVIALSGALQDESSSVRESAVKALGQIGDAQAVPALEGALNDRDRFVQRSVIEALGQIGGAKAVAALAAVLRYKDRRLRESAINALKRIDEEQAITALALALKEKNPDVRLSAVEALSSLGGDEVLMVLTNALRDEDSMVREQAAKALRRIGGELAIGALVNALSGLGREKALEETRAFIVHEVRSALGPLQAMAKALDTTLAGLNLKNDKVAEYVQHILKQTEIAYNVMNQYMNYTKVLMPALKLTDVNHILRETLGEILPQCESQGIEIIRRLKQTDEVMADSALISQALRNLFLNSIEAMKRNGKIIVTTQQNKQQVVITISDTGPGIKPDHLEQVFELGFTTKMGQQGAGLGLALVRRIIEEGHEGRINIVNNTDGTGVTTTVHLPVTTKGEVP